MRFNRPAAKPVTIDAPVTIERLSHEGRGIARVKGKTVFVDGALPGEVVELKAIESKSKFMEAQTRKVLTASVERCESLCRYANRCGGCSLQYWQHEAQLAGKEQIALDQLQRFGDTVPQQVEAPLVSTPYVYRHRARLAITWKKGQLFLGFREKASKAICNVEQCLVLAQPLQSLPGRLRELLLSLNKPMVISHAELFSANSGVGVVLRHTNAFNRQDIETLASFAKQTSVDVYLQDNDYRITAIADACEQPFYQLAPFNIQLNFQPGNFTQINWAVNEQMVQRALDWLALDKSERVLDLFCGLGNFSLPLAQQCSKVVGVEGSEASVAQATSNAALNNIENAQFYSANLAADLSAQPWWGEGFEVIVLDPPRAGAAELLQQLATLLTNSVTKKVLYISCNPATLARDSSTLNNAGFRLVQFSVMDMFPQTAHIESMALFVRL